MKTRFLSAALAAMLVPAAAMAQVAVGDATPTVGTTVFPAQDGTQTGILVSSQVRSNDPTILDAKFIVYGDESETVKVRALAFEDGERSFLKVVRPETFVADPDGNPTVQNIGDAIPCNTELNLSWKVSTDWATDLAKVRFEVLAVRDLPLPLDLVEIPAADAHHPGLTVTTNTQTDTDVFNALLWHFASKTEGMTLDNGYLYADGLQVASRTSLTSKFAALGWLYEKAGFRVLEGALLAYAKDATRLALGIASQSPYAYEVATAPESVYVGENAYCVIDLSGGASAESYPVTYLDSFPTAGWSDDYKTTKLILRKCPAGVFVMSRNAYSWDNDKPHSVTLTHPFYLGVFEVTQKQYELVTGKTPSYYKGDKRPAECVSWNEIRGNSDTYNWPISTDVDPNSFVGLISARTGLAFDLPTEAQWEYACLAGTTSDPDYRLFARTANNRTDGLGGYSDAHTIVGSYCANDWGFYDMRGNVFELTLDWFAFFLPDPVCDPVGAETGTYRVAKGGCWNYTDSLYGTSHYRWEDPPSSHQSFIGFRISRTLP